MDLVGKFDYVIDGGTIEHVFNFPKVLENIFKLLKPGGTFIFDQPVMVYLNHGFYNFSPEVYYEYFKVKKLDTNQFKLYKFNKNDRRFIYEVHNFNNFIFSSLYTSQDEYYLVWGSVTKTNHSTFDAIPYQGSYSDLWEKDENNRQRLLEIYENNNSIYLYGTGKHSINLLSTIPKQYKCKVKGVLSNRINDTGKNFKGYKVFDLSMLNAGDAIIISSEIYQDIIFDRIKHVEESGIKVVKLYG